jgi:GNAT superfamily N-acetyltransferase
LEIIIAKPDDLHIVRDITQTTINTIYPRYYPAGAVQFFLEHHSDEHIIADISCGKVFILYADGNPAGTVTISDNNINRLFVLPKYQRKGYGKALLEYSLEIATGLGYGAVLIEGDIGFYGRCGFTYAREFGIRYHDLPAGADDSFFLCKELIVGYLDGITGVYHTPKGYYVDDSDVEEFDKGFPPKQKLELPGQLF